MICVDASVALKLLFPEEHSERALALVEDAIAANESIVAPHLLLAEIANNALQRVRRGEITAEGAHQALERFLRFPVTVVGPAGLEQGALRIALDYDLRAVYDAIYVALAQLLGVALWTDDRRLMRDLGGGFAFVRPIAGYQTG